MLKSLLKFLSGLAVMAIGTYIEIQAGIGVCAWDCLALGISNKLGILYGNASMMVSITVICLDLVMREKIGLGTVVNGLIYGKFVDLYSAIGFCPAIEGKIWLSGLIIIAGMFFEAFGVVLYMSPSLGCGPRDTFKVGIGRHFPRVKIGYVGMTINAIVLLTGWLLGGPIGIGTVVMIFGFGFIENTVNKIVGFEPRNVRHQNFIETFGVLTGRGKKEI